MSGIYFSQKVYDYNSGFSTAFRQWRAQSHCRFLHGYAFRFELTFAALDLDSHNWVVDFGGLKSFKQMLEDTFDHKTLVALDDPHIEWFREGKRLGTMDLIEVDHTGCERMAEMIFLVAEQWVKDAGYGDRVFMWNSEVREHTGNGAMFYVPATRQLATSLWEARLTVPSEDNVLNEAFEKGLRDIEKSIRKGARRSDYRFKP